MTSTPAPTTSVARLHTRTTSVPAPTDGADLFGCLPGGLDPRDVFTWVREGAGLIGWGRAASVTTTGSARFFDARTWWAATTDGADVADDVGLPGTGPVAFGSFAYSAASPTGGTLVVPRVVVGHRDGAWWRTTQRLVVDDARHAPATGGTDATSDDGRDAGRAGGVASGEHHDTHARVTIAEGARTAGEWREAVQAAVDRIGTGELDKVVLARDLHVTCEDPIDPTRLTRRLAHTYDRTWVFSVDGVVGATPEMLVRLERGLATSRVLAGTIRRTGDDSHDLTLAASLARSSKDLEEHDYAVRSVVDALAPFCTSTTVPEMPSVLHLPNVMHLATDVAGRMRTEVSSLDLAAALHPSAAVCGTPREAADTLITDLEGMDRGRYAGPVGWIDARGDGEWGIALRSGAIDADDPHRMRIFAGCGIVAGSDPAAELAESEAKFVPMRGALTGGV